jgi:hypothetical protein
MKKVEYTLIEPVTSKQMSVCSHPSEDLDNLHLKRKVLKAPLVCT